MNFCEKLKKNLTNTHWCEPSHLISHLQIISNYSRQRQPLPSLVWHTWRAQLASAPDSTAHHYDTQREREKWELRCHFNWHVTNSHRLPTNHQRESTSPRENGDKSSSAQPQFWRGENLNPFTCISRELRVCHLAASVRRYGMWRFPIESTCDKMTQRWQLAPTNPSNRVQCCLQAIIFKLCKLGAVGWGNVFINQLVVFFGDDHRHQCSSSSDPETWPSRRGLWEIIVVGLGGRISVDTCWLQQLPRGELVGSLHNS